MKHHSKMKLLTAVLALGIVAGAALWQVRTNESGDGIICLAGADEAAPGQPELTDAVNESESIRVSWKEVPDVSGYYVYRKTAKENWTKIADVTDAGVDGSVSYSDSTAVPGVHYFYTVRSYKGELKSGCDVKGVSIVCLRPVVMKELVENEKGITISWNPVEGADGYYVYKSIGKKTDWKRIETLKGKDSTSCLDPQANQGKEIRYTVKAFNGAGTSVAPEGLMIQRKQKISLGRGLFMGIGTVLFDAAGLILILVDEQRKKARKMKRKQLRAELTSV